MKEPLFGDSSEFVSDVDKVPGLEIVKRANHEAGHDVRHERGRGKCDDGGEGDSDESEELPACFRFLEGDDKQDGEYADYGQSDHDDLMPVSSSAGHGLRSADDDPIDDPQKDNDPGGNRDEGDEISHFVSEHGGHDLIDD